VGPVDLLFRHGVSSLYSAASSHLHTKMTELYSDERLVMTPVITIDTSGSEVSDNSDGDGDDRDNATSSEVRCLSHRDNDGGERPPFELPTIMMWKGVRFTAQNRYPDTVNKGIWRGRYRCSIYRSEKGRNCKASLKVTYNPDEENNLTIDASLALHTCITKSVNLSPDDDDRSRKCEGILDAREEMKSLCEQKALSNMDMTSIAIANEVVDLTGAKYDELSKL
jgi:hypothetical protein